MLLLLLGSPAALASRHQTSRSRTCSQVFRPNFVHSRKQRLLTNCSAHEKDDSEEIQPVVLEDGGWAADNISTGQLRAGDAYSHHLPWKGYVRMMFMAIEAEADSKQEMQEAYDGCLDPNSDSSSTANSLSVLEDDSSDEEGMYADNYRSIDNRFRIDVPPPSPLPPSTDFTQHLQKAMEAHGAAQQLRQAAEVESQRFFESMSAASGTSASCCADWAAQAEDPNAVFVELETAIQQGIQAAADQFIAALHSARALLQDTQAALANCMAKMRLEMSLTPADSQERQQQDAALQQLQQLTEATLDELAAGLTSHFLPGATLSTDEARDWLEELWSLDMPPAEDSGSDEDDLSL